MYILYAMRIFIYRYYSVIFLCALPFWQTGGYPHEKKNLPTRPHRISAPGVATFFPRARFAEREGVFRDSFRGLGRVEAGARAFRGGILSRNSGSAAFPGGPSRP